MIIDPYCYDCKHFIDDDSTKFHCKAFDGIPTEILLGKNDHTSPYPGDNGIQFEPKEDEGS
ncbi:MAG: hypothetical protein H7A25_22250 [Leptospiraceae bacterium]|nr:hypothetical protein [Leptospiraceae bacterium]MCP5502636.1 hypothetical protein [Leptospiraceae bacterium]